MYKLIALVAFFVAVAAQQQPFTGFQIGVVQLNGQRFGSANQAATFQNAPVYYKNGFFAAPVNAGAGVVAASPAATVAPAKVVRPQATFVAAARAPVAAPVRSQVRAPIAIPAPIRASVAVPAPTPAPAVAYQGAARIVSQVHAAQPSAGAYRFHYQTENGIHAQEINTPKVLAGQENVNAVRGTYSYIAPDGQLVAVSYIADENGFRPQIHGEQGARLATGATLPASVRLPVRSVQ